MSISSIITALEQVNIRPASRKFVLVVLCNFANKYDEAWPANSTVQSMTGYDERTVQQSISELSSAGWIEDTGERKGRTKQVRVWRITFRKGLEAIASQALGETPTKVSGLAKKNGEGGHCSGNRIKHKGKTPAKLRVLPNTNSFICGSPAKVQKEPVTDPVPLETAKAVSVPKGPNRRIGNSRIEDRWLPPKILNLPDEVAAIVEHWPPAAYEAQAGAFRDYWQAEGGCRAVKRDWERAWYSWIRRAGLNVKAPAIRNSAPSSKVKTIRVLPPVLEKSAEQEVEWQIRAAFAEFLETEPEWLRRCGLKVKPIAEAGGPVGMTVFSPAALRNQIDSKEGLFRQAAAQSGLQTHWIAILPGAIDHKPMLAE